MSTPVPARHDALQPSGAETARPGLLPRLTAEAFGSFFVTLAGLGVPLFSIPAIQPVACRAWLSFSRAEGGNCGGCRNCQWQPIA